MCFVFAYVIVPISSGVFDVMSVPPSLLVGLPWTPKVRQKDIDTFLDSTRVKFVGFQLQGDRTSLAGLPLPIHEGVKVLSKVSWVLSWMELDEPLLLILI